MSRASVRASTKGMCPPYLLEHCLTCCPAAGWPEDPPRGPLSLWVADATSGVARCLLAAPQYRLNTVLQE